MKELLKALDSLELKTKELLDETLEKLKELPHYLKEKKGTE